ncbi:hypothetical protein Vadar_030730 [Vaccinium darrowii]|uniref:Uncharacterized protein n=1 Tax=Vaccinium darrowii TaxID=229202 RepID=A0ACB7YR01_9ERIC|nr:hypothetical protein Vadar_030730 [Vaccinium darrowii]
MAAETILTAIGKKAGELAVNQIIIDGSRLCRVREDLEWIEIEMGRIQSYLQDAEAIQLKTAVVSNFIREIWNLAYDVEDIIHTYFPKLISSWSQWNGLLGFRHMKSARAFSKGVEGIRKRVEDITKARKDFEADARSTSLEAVTTYPRQTFPHADEPYVVGINTIVEDLKQKVLDKDLHHPVVSIIGTAGVGKTALARKVYNSVRQHFDCAAWICVSERPNEQQLLRDIAGQVGLEENKMEQNFETNLFELLSTKRYVIVIDDIWRTTAWDALKIHLPTNSENERQIILTSRIEDVGLYVGGTKSIFKLQPLDLETSRQLFYKMIADDPQNINETQYSPQLKNIGEQILEKCGGLPLAILLAAGLLRGRSDSAWKGVLEGILGMGQDNDKWFDIFALSYKDLPLYLKPCFLYFGFFPEDREIEAFDLINLWAAEGFIRGSEVREVEEVGDDYLNQLIARNLIQVNQMKLDGTVFTVQIHDILHSLCIREANEINFFKIHTDAVNWHSTCKVRRIAIHNSDIGPYLSLHPQTSRIHAMLCFFPKFGWEEMIDPKKNEKREGRVTKNLLQDSKSFRLLRIENDYIPLSVSTEICNLRQLTYLKLANISGPVELPSAISNLKSLLTLDLRESWWGIYVPNVIWSMKQLRHILLPPDCRTSKYRWDSLGKLQRVEFSLTNLQTLSGLSGELFKADWLYKLNSLRTLGVYNPTKTWSKDIIEVLSDGAPVSHKLEKLWLHTYKDKQPILKLPKLKSNSLNLSRYENLCSLDLNRLKMTELPQHDKLPPNLTILTLAFTYIEKGPMETLKKLQKLKILQLLMCSYEGKELVCPGEHGDFPELEVLRIEGLPYIEMVVVEEEGMPRLRDFKIIKYPGYSKMPETRIPDRLRNIIVMTTE